ncbi:MAG: YkgJ family cysteine cluster protein [Vampirovibrionales bacterium]
MNDSEYTSVSTVTTIPYEHSSLYNHTAPFQCSQCGHCCTHWRVPVPKAKAEQWQLAPWVQALLQTHGLPSTALTEEAIPHQFLPRLAWPNWRNILGWLQPKQPYARPDTEAVWGYWLPQTDQRVCVFFEGDTVNEQGERLQQGRGCLIHAHWGAAEKPLDCQRFPFVQSQWQAAATDASSPPPALSVTYDTSGACSTIASWFIPQWFQATPQALEAEANNTHEAFPLHSPPTPEEPWLYWHGWQRGLYAFMGHRGRFNGLSARFFTRLLDSLFNRISLEAWQERLHTLRGWQYALPSVPLLGFMHVAGVCLFQRNPHPLHLWQAVREAEHPTYWQGGLSHSGLLLTCLWRTLAKLRQPYGFYGWWQWGISAKWHDPLIFDAPVACSVVDVYRFVQHPNVQQWAKAFYWHTLQRRMGLRVGLSLHQHRKGCLAGVGLVCFYAALLHAKQGRLTPRITIDEALLALAIRIVERYYTAHQPRFYL